MIYFMHKLRQSTKTRWRAILECFKPVCRHCWQKQWVWYPAEWDKGQASLAFTQSLWKQHSRWLENNLESLGNNTEYSHKYTLLEEKVLSGSRFYP